MGPREEKPLFGCRVRAVACNGSMGTKMAINVPGAGIEPALPKEQDFESSASTSSATRAFEDGKTNEFTQSVK